jgi:hypothetical protein
MRGRAASPALRAGPTSAIWTMSAMIAATIPRIRIQSDVLPE